MAVHWEHKERCVAAELLKEEKNGSEESSQSTRSEKRYIPERGYAMNLASCYSIDPCLGDFLDRDMAEEGMEATHQALQLTVKQDSAAE